MLFTGAYRRALDEKLRLPLPKPLREPLEPAARLYLTPGLDGCLALYTEAAFSFLAERLAASSPAAREVRDYSRMFYSQAACVTPDGQWRVRIPPELRQWASLDGEVVIVGVRDHMELWSAAKWDQYVARCDPHYDLLAEHALSTPLPSVARSVAPLRKTIPNHDCVAPPDQPR
jgi:MraZ protein